MQRVLLCTGRRAVTASYTARRLRPVLGRNEAESNVRNEKKNITTIISRTNVPDDLHASNTVYSKSNNKSRSIIIIKIITQHYMHTHTSRRLSRVRRTLRGRKPSRQRFHGAVAYRVYHHRDRRRGTYRGRCTKNNVCRPAPWRVCGGGGGGIYMFAEEISPSGAGLRRTNRNIRAYITMMIIIIIIVMTIQAVAGYRCLANTNKSEQTHYTGRDEFRACVFTPSTTMRA